MKCKDNVELPSRGPCPVCGATRDQRCKGRDFAEMLARAHAAAEAKTRKQEEDELIKRFMQEPDRRVARSNT